MPLKGVLGVWHRFKKEFWCRLLALFFTSVKASWAPFCTFLASKSGKKGSSRFALYPCDFSGCWTPFWGSCSPNLAKRGPAACSFGVPWFSFSFSSRWSPFWGSCSPNLAKRGPAACSFGVPWSCLSFSSCWAPFCAAGVLDPPKRGPAASDFRFLPFSLVLYPFSQPWAAEILQKGAPQLDIYVAPISASTCYFFGAGKVHCFFCKRIPLRHYNARAWTWPPLLWRETGLLLLLIGFSLSTAGPLFQPWAAEILERGAPQPDVKRAAIWFFSVPLPHTEAVPPSALSVPALCACRLVRVAFFSPDPFSRNTVRNELCRAHFYPRLA